MLNRYAVDRSYWQGALKINEALRHVAVSFTTGAPETMLERDAVRLLPWFGVALVVAVGALVWQGSRGSRGEEERRSRGDSSSCLFVYLSTRPPPGRPPPRLADAQVQPALPDAGFTGVSADSGRRHRRVGGMASERISGAANERATDTLAQPERTHHASRITHHASRLAVILSAFLIVTSVIGLRNWFTDPAFTKAQWRELAAAVRAQIAPDEAVLLVSGHASPAWDYYAPDIPRTRLPEIDILDVDAVLGFDAGAQLEQALAGKAGAWLVSWQDAVVDPAGFVPYFLDRAGAEQPVTQQFWHLGLRHWRLRPDATFPAEASPAHVQSANFDHKLALLGWDDPQDGSTHGLLARAQHTDAGLPGFADPGGRAGPRGGPVGRPARPATIIRPRAGSLVRRSSGATRCRCRRTRPRATTP